jgi:hypothetical protein
MAFGLSASEAPDLIRAAGHLGDAVTVYGKGKAVKTLVIGLLVSALVPGVAQWVLSLGNPGEAHADPSSGEGVAGPFRGARPSAGIP